MLDGYRLVQNGDRVEVWHRNSMLSSHESAAAAKSALANYRAADKRRAHG